jgi:hypothetical protein
MVQVEPVDDLHQREVPRSLARPLVVVGQARKASSVTFALKSG